MLAQPNHNVRIDIARLFSTFRVDFVPCFFDSMTNVIRSLQCFGLKIAPANPESFL